MTYRLLEWDSAFFGFRVARFYLPLPTNVPGNAGAAADASWRAVFDALTRDKVRLAYWSTPVQGGEPTGDLEELGGRMVDLKTWFGMDLRQLPDTVAPGNMAVVPYDATMPVADLVDLALQSGEYSRFAVDPLMPAGKFTALYTRWMLRSLARELADEVLVARVAGRLAGMVTLRRNQDVGEIGLIGVHRDYRGGGVGTALVRSAQHWFVERGLRRATVVTQGANQAACRLYQRCGYRLEQQEYFFHFWLPSGDE